jgi:hypothetical protein
VPDLGVRRRFLKIFQRLAQLWRCFFADRNPPSVFKNANTFLPSFCAGWNSAPVYVSPGVPGIKDPALNPMIKTTASDSCTCSELSR